MRQQFCLNNFIMLNFAWKKKRHRNLVFLVFQGGFGVGGKGRKSVNKF